MSEPSGGEFMLMQAAQVWWRTSAVGAGAGDIADGLGEIAGVAAKARSGRCGGDSEPAWACVWISPLHGWIIGG